MLYGCFISVFSKVIRVVKECYLGVTKVFLGCHKVVTLRRAEKLKFSKFFPGVSKSGYFTQANHFCFMNVPLKMTPSHPFLAVCV